VSLLSLPGPGPDDAPGFVVNSLPEAAARLTPRIVLRTMLLAASWDRVTLSDSLPSVARAAAASSAPLKRCQKSHSSALASRRGIGKYSPPLLTNGEIKKKITEKNKPS